MKIKLIYVPLMIGLLFSNSMLVLSAQDVNVALGKKVETTSADSKYPADNILDGKITRESKWMSATSKPPHIVEINFEKYCNINEIKFHSGIPENERTANEKNQANGFWSVKNFKLQYWDDANWTDFPKASILENRQITNIFKFENPISTFKIRMVADDGEAINIMEIEVMGSIATDMPAPPSLDSDIKKQVEITEDQTASIKVRDTVIGKSFKYVGYNQGYFMPSYNVSGWLEYAGVNSIRIWPNLNTYVPKKMVQRDASITSVEEFDERKATLRADPEKNTFIKWNDLKILFKTPDYTSNNTMVLKYALTESRKLGIKPVLQINSRDFDNKWSTKWQQWQRYYALAYYAAKVGDVEMFAMQNEPNHAHSGPMELDQWIAGMQIVSDALHAAIADINKKYNKNLKAKFVGPVTAGQNTDWWATIAKNIRTDYHGNTLDYDLIDIFSTHSYNSPAAGYATRVNNIRKVLVKNHPKKESIPIVFTEIGRWMNAYLIDKEETMDSPSLFTEWAGIYANNMNNGAYGMWAFKLVNNVSNSYPRGIKSGHHYTWQSYKFVEDAHKNLAQNAKVKTSEINSETTFVTDGDKSDASAWISKDDTKEKWLEIDLGSIIEIGSALVYNGSAGGVFTAPDRIRNFKLQSWNGKGWDDIPTTEQENNKYAQVYLPFSKPIKTSKIRFLSRDEGALKIREIKLFDKNGVPDKDPNYNISGIQRTGQVVRLFAKGFKEEKELYKIERSNEDNGLDTYISYDKENELYYMWLVQRGNFAYHLDIDLSDLKVSAGSPIMGETVDAKAFGEVTTVMALNADKKIKLTLAPQSVTLLSISSAKLKKETISAKADTYISGGKESTKNYGNEQELKVSLDASTPENNSVSFISFDIPKDTKNISKILLNISGKVDTGNKPFRSHVYAIPSEVIDENKLNWDNAPHLYKNEALIKDIGNVVKVAGEIAFTNIDTIHYLDVTDLVLKNNSQNITFIIIRETRQLGDDEDKGRTVMLKSKESKEAPSLDIWREQ